MLEKYLLLIGFMVFCVSNMHAMESQLQKKEKQLQELNAEEKRLRDNLKQIQLEHDREAKRNGELAIYYASRYPNYISYSNGTIFDAENSQVSKQKDMILSSDRLVALYQQKIEAEKQLNDFLLQK